jgi:hypothetical protein
LLCFIPLLSQAALVKNLYEVSTPVDNQSTAERNKAFSMAFKEVLVRVSGDTNVLENEEIKKLLFTPARFIQEFRYEQVVSETLVEADEAPQIVLLSLFNEVALQNALVERGVRVWPANRPDVLVWFAVQEKKRRYMLWGNDAEDVESYIDAAAQRRGLPLVWPLQSDLELGKVTVADVKAGFHDQILETSRSYHTQGVLIGALRQSGLALWQVTWKFVIGDEIIEWKSDIDTQEAVIHAGMDFVADKLAMDYAVEVGAENAETIQVRVTGVNQLSDYAQIRQYLGDMVIVDSLQEVSLLQGTANFALKLRGSQSGFERTLALENKMRLIEIIDVPMAVESVIENSDGSTAVLSPISQEEPTLLPQSNTTAVEESFGVLEEGASDPDTRQDRILVLERL